MKVCIESQADGTYQVYQDDEAAEQPGATPGMPEGQEQAEPKQAQAQTANSLEDALKVIIKIFRDQPGGMKPNPFEQGMNSAMNPQQMQSQNQQM